MRLVVLTYGTEGDTRPLIALSYALRQAGHEVHLLGDARTLGLASTCAIPASPLSGDVRTLFSEWAQKGPRSTSQALVKLTNENSAAWMKQTLDVAQGCDAIVTSGLAGFVGLSVAERLDVPAIGAGMIPLTPSREFASPFLPPSWVPRGLNKASLALTNQLFWFAFKKALNQARDNVLALPSRKTLWTDHSMLYGISPTLLPRPKDWPANAYVCGQWILRSGADYTPSDDLARFLARGDAPIYMGFGSMTGIDMPKIVKQMVAALDGRRAIFARGWNGLGEVTLPDNILCIDETPHDWLFPRMAAVIHHGGSGTTHSALRAGKPSIVMPFVGDQHFWASRLQRLGVASAPISPVRADVKCLSDALCFVESKAVVGRAVQLGQTMSCEDGLANGVATLEKLLVSAR